MTDCQHDDKQVTHPAHYSHTRIEPADAIMLLGLDWPSGNVVKYLVRWQRKNGIEDLKKARQLITMMIEREAAWYPTTPQEPHGEHADRHE